MNFGTVIICRLARVEQQVHQNYELYQITNLMQYENEKICSFFNNRIYVNVYIYICMYVCIRLSSFVLNDPSFLSFFLSFDCLYLCMYVCIIDMMMMMMMICQLLIKFRPSIQCGNPKEQFCNLSIQRVQCEYVHSLRPTFPRQHALSMNQI